VLVVLMTFVPPSSSEMMSLGNGNNVEIPDEARSYCGMDLVRAIRKFCHAKVIDKYKVKPPLYKNFHRDTAKCGENIKDKCCYRNNKCDIVTFVQYCPYRYRSKDDDDDNKENV
jgi:hypothetical protein